ncbi:MAG: hypothetical protein JNL11_18545 [Bdellovibrionaceae bacterium]|nr:hypothetical protein [Pseudobdellovibrionaceae bacterium]
MRSLLFLTLATFITSVFLISCNNKDEGNKDAEIQQAKIAYDRCVSIKGQAYCNAGKAGTLASLAEFYGQSAYYNFYGYNNYLAVNPNTTNYNQDQLNVYFENYLKSSTKQDILLLSNRWYQMSTEVNSLASPLNTFGRRCTIYGCY